MHEEGAKPIVYFDAECHFCQACARFLKRIDTKQRLTLTPIQQKAGVTEATCHESIIFLRADYQSQYSRAIVDILLTIGGPWKLLAGLIWLIPRPLRDWGYKLVGRHRHWLGGEKPSC